MPQAAQPAPPNTAPGQTNNPDAVVGDARRAADRRGAAGFETGRRLRRSPPPALARARVDPIARSRQRVRHRHQHDQHGGRVGQQEHVRADRPGQSQPTPAPGDVNTGYFLQVGAYKTQADAEQQRARLGFQGFESKVTERDAGGVTYYRVRIGPFTKFEDMNNVRQRLSDAGVDTAVIRFSKQ